MYMSARHVILIRSISRRSFTFMDQVNFVDPRWYKFRRFLRKYCPMCSISFYYIIMDQKRFLITDHRHRGSSLSSQRENLPTHTHSPPLTHPNPTTQLASISTPFAPSTLPPSHTPTHFPVSLTQG